MDNNWRGNHEQPVVPPTFWKCYKLHAVFGFDSNLPFISALTQKMLATTDLSQRHQNITKRHKIVTYSSFSSSVPLNVSPRRYVYQSSTPKPITKITKTVVEIFVLRLMWCFMATLFTSTMQERNWDDIIDFFFLFLQ